MHKSEVFVQIVKVIVFAFSGDRAEFEQAVILFYRLEGLAVLYHRKDADQPLRNRVVFQDIQGTLLFGQFG